MQILFISRPKGSFSRKRRIRLDNFLMLMRKRNIDVEGIVEARSFENAKRAYIETQPDLVLIDADGHRDPLRTVAQIRKQYTNIPIIVAVSRVDPMFQLDAIGAGASGVVASSSSREFIQGVDRAISFERFRTARNTIGHAIGLSSPKSINATPKESVTLIWDPDILSGAEYAELVKAIGDLVRADGGIGISRIESCGVGLPANAEVTV